jgi:hypothetical protein
MRTAIKIKKDTELFGILVSRLFLEQKRAFFKMSFILFKSAARRQQKFFDRRQMLLLFSGKMFQ